MLYVKLKPVSGATIWHTKLGKYLFFVGKIRQNSKIFTQNQLFPSFFDTKTPASHTPCIPNCSPASTLSFDIQNSTKTNKN
jgi:hypothetical protein